MLRIRTLVVILILVGGVAGVTAELSTEHSVDIAGSINIPAQTVETEWGEATITQVGKEKLSENLEVSTDAPENESYAIRIVDSEERNLEARFIDEGDDVEASFALNRFDPGTYVVVLTQDGGDTAVALEPFIIKGYTIDQSVSDATGGESISVDIQLTSVVDDPVDPQAVNVTLFGNDLTRSVEAKKTGENSYQANFTTEELSTGSYNIYTGIETNDDIYGYNELIGLSDSSSVTVEDSENSTPTPTPEPVETGNIGGGSGAEDSETSSPTVEETSTETIQPSSSQYDNQSNVTEPTQTEIQGQTSEPITTKTVSQTQQPTPSNTESESRRTTTTSSEVPIFPSGGIIILFSILIGILHRLHRPK